MGLRGSEQIAVPPATLSPRLPGVLVSKVGEQDLFPLPVLSTDSCASPARWGISSAKKRFPHRENAQRLSSEQGVKLPSGMSPQTTTWSSTPAPGPILLSPGRAVFLSKALTLQLAEMQPLQRATRWTPVRASAILQDKTWISLSLRHTE